MATSAKASIVERLGKMSPERAARSLAEMPAAERKKAVAEVFDQDKKLWSKLLAGAAVINLRAATKQS